MSVVGGQGDARETATRRVLKHVLVREHVQEVIRDAEPGTPTPSERELVARLGVARMTVRQALEALVAEGVLERQPGRGTFVAQRPPPQRGVIGYSEEAHRAGLTTGGQTLVTRFIQATPAIADLLGTHPGERVMQWERLRSTDGLVTTVQMIYLNPDLLPGWPIDAPPTSLYEELERRELRPTSCEDVLKPSEATPREAGLLQIPNGAPVLRQQRRTESWGRTVEVSSSVHRFDRFRLRYHSGR